MTSNGMLLIQGCSEQWARQDTFLTPQIIHAFDACNPYPIFFHSLATALVSSTAAYRVVPIKVNLL